MCGTYGVGRNVRVGVYGLSLGLDLDLDLDLGQALMNRTHLMSQLNWHMKF